jgi:hypothetical protein
MALTLSHRMVVVMLQRAGTRAAGPGDLSDAARAFHTWNPAASTCSRVKHLRAIVLGLV